MRTERKWVYQVSRTSQIKLDEMIDYHGGLLNGDFTKAILDLYEHVVEEGDNSDQIYNDESVEDMKLPLWLPKKDDQGLSRRARLEMAVEFDVWQWYLITNENFTLLDTLGEIG